jgi:hypothetical protein
MDRMTERRLVRWILFAVPVVCAVQWAIVRKIGEPYPAVMMPSFASDAKAAYSVKTPTLVVNRADGTSSELPAYRLFPDYSGSIAVIFVDRGLFYERTLSSDAADWVWLRVVNIEPTAASAKIRWTREFPLTHEPAAWLGDLTIR